MDIVDNRWEGKQIARAHTADTVAEQGTKPDSQCTRQMAQVPPEEGLTNFKANSQCNLT